MEDASLKEEAFLEIVRAEALLDSEKAKLTTESIDREKIKAKGFHLILKQELKQYPDKAIQKILEDHEWRRILLKAQDKGDHFLLSDFLEIAQKNPKFYLPKLREIALDAKLNARFAIRSIVAMAGEAFNLTLF